MHCLHPCFLPSAVFFMLNKVHTIVHITVLYFVHAFSSSSQFKFYDKVMHFAPSKPLNFVLSGNLQHSLNFG